MAARPRSGSRLSQVLHPERSDMDEIQAIGKSPHSTLRSRIGSPPSRHSLSSSISQQQTPARSYYHRSLLGSHGQHAPRFLDELPTELCTGPVDISQDTSQEVRDDTAELASWALSDHASFANGHSPTRRSFFSTAPSAPSNVDDQDLLDSLRSDDHPRPGIIPEVSEPASPSSRPCSSRSPRMSALSQMFRDTPPTEEEDSSTDHEDRDHRHSEVDAVRVQEGIISQPTEQTALLLKRQGYGTNHNNEQGVSFDLESQKKNRMTSAGGRFASIFGATIEDCKLANTKVTHPKSWDSKAICSKVLLKPARYIPSVGLGLLLNILDALSYGQPGS
ncbi:MAG: hypothetical protein Q9182_003838 [Xanthomendoza sp. 2 TL-2023]